MVFYDLFNIPKKGLLLLVFKYLLKNTKTTINHFIHEVLLIPYQMIWNIFLSILIKD